MEIKDVEALAEMARLDLSQEEKGSMLHDMDSILGYVKQIESVDVGDVEAKEYAHNVWRGDEAITQDFSRDSIIEQFPKSQDGFLKVKKIL